MIVSGYQTCNQVKRLGTIGPERDQDASRIFKYITEDGMFRYIKSLASSFLHANKRSMSLFDDTVQDGCLFVLQHAHKYDHEKARGNVRVFIKTYAGFGFKQGAYFRFTGLLHSSDRQKRAILKARRDGKPMKDDPQNMERVFDEETMLRVNDSCNVENDTIKKLMAERLNEWIENNCTDFERDSLFSYHTGDRHANAAVAKKHNTYMMAVYRAAEKKMYELKKEFAYA